jgi:hypothetical protein
MILRMQASSRALNHLLRAVGDPVVEISGIGPEGDTWTVRSGCAISARIGPEKAACVRTTPGTWPCSTPRRETSRRRSASSTQAAPGERAIAA